MSNIVLSIHYKKYEHLNFNAGKKSEGLISFINRTKISYNPSIDNLMKSFMELSEYQMDNNHTVHMSSEHMNYITATLNDDIDKLAWLDNQNYHKKMERRNREYTKLFYTLSKEMYDTFWKVDLQYDRHITYTNDILFMGSTYSYCWYSKINVKYRGHEDCEILIKMDKSGFHLEVFYASECGYDQGVGILDSNIDPSELFNKLKNYKHI